LLPIALRKYIVDGAHLDPADKDTVKKCISSWICELGELDATFRKADIARLKAFLSNETDDIRLPYDRAASSFQRKTVFGASVNTDQFLTDITGSRRFLPLAVIECKPLHNINHQQLWAQVWYLYKNGMKWWCDEELEVLLYSRHAKHAEVNVVGEMLADVFDMNAPEQSFYSGVKHEFYTITQALYECGIKVPTKDQIKLAKVYLEDNHFKQVMNSKGIRGYYLSKLLAN
jgi:putative DNA primase/helicase